MWVAKYFEERAILAPTNDIVREVNEYISSMSPTDEKEYLSSNNLSEGEGYIIADHEVYSTDFLNSIRTSGHPYHRIALKIGTPIMLMRNHDIANGLCNGTRLLVIQLSNHVIQANVITGTNIGYKVFIPRLSLTPSDNSTIPIMFQRIQFPIMVCYAMTINKNQGQSLSQVRLFLPSPVFSHGQFYVAISRVTTKKRLKILICDKEGRTLTNTQNVV